MAVLARTAACAASLTCAMGLASPTPAAAVDAIGDGAAVSARGAEVRAAAPDAQGRRMTAAFRAWATKWNVPKASFVAMRDATVIGQAGRGGRSAATAAPVASLSKAITGVCVAKLVEAGKLSYGMRLSRLLPAYLKANPPADPRARQITVGQLLTHTSGLTYDPTQGASLAQFDFGTKNLGPQVAAALARPLGQAPGAYAYNNAGYAALGLIIETVTGKPYERHCADSVLKPAGATGAVLNPRWRVLSSYGGWKLSALAYARFLDHFRPGSKLMKSRPASWPTFEAGGGASYRIGAYVRANGASFNFWHAGAFRWRDAERNEDFGAYFAMIRANVRYVATYAPQPPAGALSDLDVSLFRAAYP